VVMAGSENHLKFIFILIFRPTTAYVIFINMVKWRG
jgi:hypothetical protein